MDYALGLSQPSNSAGAQFLLSGAEVNLDNHEVGHFKNEILQDLLNCAGQRLGKLS